MTLPGREEEGGRGPGCHLCVQASVRALRRLSTAGERGNMVRRIRISPLSCEIRRRPPAQPGTLSTSARDAPTLTMYTKRLAIRMTLGAARFALSTESPRKLGRPAVDYVPRSSVKVRQINP